MAGDWIKVEHVTPDKPEIVELAEILSIDQDAAFGKLIRFWIWADQQSVSGDALAVTATFIDRLTNCSGFASGLLKVGWLISRNSRYSVPNFDRHNGQSAKGRALAKDRMKRARYGDSATLAQPEEEENEEVEKSKKEIHKVDSIRFDLGRALEIESRILAKVRPKNAGDRTLIRRTALAVASCGMPEFCAISAANGTAAETRQNPMSYFTAVLKEHCEKTGFDFKSLKTIKIPPDWPASHASLGIELSKALTPTE